MRAITVSLAALALTIAAGAAAAPADLILRNAEIWTVDDAKPAAHAVAIAGNRIVAVGDSLEHDIAGGRRFGCLTAFVEAGIHAADLAQPDGFDRLCEKYGATPDFVIPKLVW